MAILHYRIEVHRSRLIYNDKETVIGIEFTLWISADPATYRERLEREFASTAESLGLESIESVGEPTKWELIVGVGDKLPQFRSKDWNGRFVDQGLFVAHTVNSIEPHLRAFADAHGLEIERESGPPTIYELPG